MDLESTRAIFAMVSCKQYPIMADETANFPRKKQLILFKLRWIMKEGSYRVQKITQCGEVVGEIKLPYFIRS